MGTGRPNTLPKQRLLLKHDSATTAIELPTGPGVCVCVHPQTSCAAPLQHHGQLSAILVTAIIVSTGLMTWPTTSPGNILTTQKPAGQHALTIGHFRLHCSKVKCPPRLLQAPFIDFFSLSFFLWLSHLFLLQFWLDSAQRGLNTWDKWERRLCSLIWPSQSPSLSLSVLHNLVSTFPVCSPVFSLSAFYRMRFCCPAPNKFTEHVINTEEFAFNSGERCALQDFHML